MISPDDIRDQRFLVALRGYDRDEVGAFLEDVASQVANLEARIKELETLLSKERNRASGPVPDTAIAAAEPTDTRELLKVLGEETTRILVTAEESARMIEHKADERAREATEQARRSARDETERASRQAAKLIADAERRRDAIAAVIRDLEAQRDRFVEHLTTAVQTVAVVSDDLGSAGDSADEPPAESAPAATSLDVPVETADAPATTAEDLLVTEAVDTVPARRDASLDALRDDMARKLRRGLQDLQNTVLEGIRTGGSSSSLDDLLPREPVLDDLGIQGQAFLTQGYEAGLIDAAAEVDGDAPKQLVDGARLPAASATLRAVLAHEVVSALRATLRAGLEAGEPETSLSERVGEVFRDLKGPVLDGLVGTHIDRIYAHGLLDGWQELGVKHIRWQVGDELRCPEQRCRSNAEEGPVELGIDFPSGDRVPPAHQGCTCVIVPETS